MYARGETMDGSGDLDRDFAVLLDRCDSAMRHLLFATALAPSGIYVEDLAVVSGLTAEGLDQAINNRASRDFLQSVEQFGTTQVQVFHASLRDHLLENMARIGVVEVYLSRLHSQLLNNGLAVYGQMNEESVTKRDAAALRYSRKLRLYEPLLCSNSKTRESATLLLDRIDSLRFGGRSFSLYSLLVLARANALSIRAEDGERFLNVLHKVIGEDSFLHVEYAVLLLGIVISMADLNLHPESIQTCRRRISLLAKLPREQIKSRVAEVVDRALTERVNPVKEFELEEMLPRTYSEATMPGTEDWKSSDLELKIARLIQTPVSAWTEEQRKLMDSYIRFTEEKANAPE